MQKEIDFINLEEDDWAESIEDKSKYLENYKPPEVL
jgi:hypothetical protein